jgi:hypothetical protein
LSRPKNHAAKSLFIGYQESLQKLHLKKVWRLSWVSQA